MLYLFIQHLHTDSMQSFYQLTPTLPCPSPIHYPVQNLHTIFIQPTSIHCTCPIDIYTPHTSSQHLYNVSAQLTSTRRIHQVSIIHTLSTQLTAMHHSIQSLYLLNVLVESSTQHHQFMYILQKKHYLHTSKRQSNATRITVESENKTQTDV